MRKLLRSIVAVVVAAVVAVTLSGCGEDIRTAQSSEDNSRQTTYERLVANQPAGTMNYSPTRATKNFWIETWDEPGKLAYVYMQNANGDLLGYYVFEGLPVSYCVSLIPPYQIYDGYDNDIAVPAPSVDGTYASSANCSTYYGKDATTGQYMEYTVGFGINILTYEMPLPRQDVQPLGWTTLDQVG